MAKREISREELFALVWERPTSEIAIELGVSDVAVGKLCDKMQVPKVTGRLLPRRFRLDASDDFFVVDEAV
ncbi:hypothetical protein GOB99_15240, partial [Sinorhizobium meliloti]|nr:hypothetical protein [Sinorhizobium meliloti]MDX0238268.1 hypothetical protein [Sinorhizobium meliloti]